VHDNFSRVCEFSHIKRGEGETVPEFHGRFVKALHKIHSSFRPRNILLDYAFAFDLEFRSLLWSDKPTDLGQAFSVALRVKEFLAAEKRQHIRSLACDKEDKDDSCFDDHEPVVA
jgi:hypothetical protein